MKRISAIALRTENRTKPSNSILSEGDFSNSLTESIESTDGRTMKNMFEFVFERSLLITLVIVTRKMPMINETDKNFVLLKKLYFDATVCGLFRDLVF